MASCMVYACYIYIVLGILVLKGAEAQRAFFVFGDSLVDNGNNNFLATTARADAPPYGIDFPTGRPTGRFSNGYNIPDFISTYIPFLILSIFHYYIIIIIMYLLVA